MAKKKTQNMFNFKKLIGFELLRIPASKKKKQFQKILTFGDDMHDRVFFHEIHIFPIEKRTNPIRVVLKSY